MMNPVVEHYADDRGILLACAHCQRVNRIPFSRVHQKAHCGGCGADLPPLSVPVAIDSSIVLNALIRDASLPLIIDFWAPWCGPCQMMIPEVSKLASLVAGELLVVKADTAATPEIGAAMHIRSIPTFAVFHRGRELQRNSGGMPAAQLRAFAFNAVRMSEAGG